MADRKQIPVTAAHRLLNRHNVQFKNHLYPYVDRGGTHQVSRALTINEHFVIKTLVMETMEQPPFLVLMHGDKAVSTKRLSSYLGVKRVTPCDPKKAQRITGYQVGGISPFGTRRDMKVFVQASIRTLDQIYINGGKRGLMLSLQPQALFKCLSCREVDVSL